MKVLELFAGTKSVGRAFEAEGHEVFSIEWEEKHKDIDWYMDISKITAGDILERFGRPDIIWASFDCTTYSIAAISHHRTREEDGNLAPKSEKAKIADATNQHVLKLIEELMPTYFFIENPRGGLRKMRWIQNLPRFTVWYCRYNDSRAKPTDIWTNHPNPRFLPVCRNGNPDCHHQRAPRGAKTGTQGIKGSVDRSRIPEELCKHIVKISTESESL